MREQTADLQELIRKRLVQTERHAAIGQLSVDVAHQLNNHLTSIIGFSQILLSDAGLPDNQRGDIATIHNDSQKCRQLLYDFMQLARRPEGEKTPIPLRTLLDGIIRLVKHNFKNSGIEIVLDNNGSLPLIFGDYAHIQHVFLSILAHSRHASGDRQPDQLTIQAESIGTRIVIKFVQNGCFLDRVYLDNLFESQALYAAEEILRQHDGNLKVYNDDGTGAVFAVELPRYDGLGKE